MTSGLSVYTEKLPGLHQLLRVSLAAFSRKRNESERGDREKERRGRDSFKKTRRVKGRNTRGADSGGLNRSTVRMARWLLVVSLASLLVHQTRNEILTPPYFNLAEGKEIIASATCGVDTPGPELYCKLVGANADQHEDINLIQGQVGIHLRSLFYIFDFYLTTTFVLLFFLVSNLNRE